MSWKNPIKPKIPSFDEVMEEDKIPSFSEVMGEKKSGGENGLEQSTPTTLQSGLPEDEYSGKRPSAYALPNQQKQGFKPKPNLGEPLPVITTPDGAQFELNNLNYLGNSPENIQSLQQRVSNKTATDQDVQILSQASGKSVSATQAYLRQDKNVGNAIEANEDFEKTTQLTVEGINQISNLVGLHFDPNEILSSPNKSAQLLQAIKQIQETEIKKHTSDVEFRKAVIAAPSYNAKNIPDEVPEIDPQRLKQSNDIQNALTNNIQKLTADEAIKNGLSSSQMGDLLYQRLDPEGYAQNQKLRQPRQSTTNLGADAIYKFADLITDSEEKNKESLNAEKSQYELLANKGMRDLAIEKKAKGIATNDQILIDEANNIIPKIKDDKEIIESSPMLMKQSMADYINQRYANDAGLLENTKANDNVTKLNLMFGVNDTLAKKYLKEGGFYDNPAYKDYVDEVATHPTSYLANNSPFGNAGSSFLKPFVSIFNTVGDLTGIRTKADIHTENIKEGLFPEQLSKDIKPDVSFSIAGHEFNMNVNNTINSVANLAGYAAIATATGGVASGAGLTANAAGRIGAWASFGMDAVDTGLKEADKIGLTPAQSWLFAGMKGVMMAEGGRLLELGKGAIPTIKGVNEGLAKAVIGISDKTLSEKAAKEAVDGTLNAWGEGLLKYGLSTAKGAGVLAGFGVGDSMLKVAFGDENTNPNDILPEAANAYMQGLFTMGLFGAVGVKGDIDNAKNSTYKGMLSKIVDNHDAAADVLKIGLDKGLYTEPEYDQKMQILNTGIKSKATLNLALEKTGISLTPEQKAVWVANATIERSLRNQAEISNVSEADAKSYIKQADNFKEQNSQVLDGLTFNKFLEPEIDLYNARKEHQEAVTEYATNPTPENEKILLNKKEAIDNIINPPKINENVKEETKKTEVLTEEKNKPSIEELKKVELKGAKQKYAKIDIEDPVTGSKFIDPKNPNELPTARMVKNKLIERHNILTDLVKCLTL